MGKRRYHAVVVTRGRENRRVIITVWFIELIIVILRLAEVVYDIAEEQQELGHFTRVGFIEVADHLVSDLVLRLRTFGAPAIAATVEDDLALVGNGLIHLRMVTQCFGERQHGLRLVARWRETQGLEFVLLVELVDRCVCICIRWMPNFECRRVGCRLRLTEHRPVNWSQRCTAVCGLAAGTICVGVFCARHYILLEVQFMFSRQSCCRKKQ
jgi:hypothetical protein